MGEEDVMLVDPLNNEEIVHNKKSNKELADSKKDEGNLMYKEGKYLQAIKLYTSAIELHPQASYYGNRSQCNLNLGSYQNALPDALKSIELDKEYIKGYVKAIQCFIALGDVRSAERQVDLFKEALPSVKDASFNTQVDNLAEMKKMINQIDSLVEKGDWRAVAFYATSALQKAPDCVRMKILLIQAKCYTKDVTDATNDAVTLLRSDERNSDFTYLYGLCLLHSDNHDKAMTALKSAIRLNPDHKEATSLIKKMNQLEKLKTQAGSLIKSKKYQEALDIYLEALEIDPLNRIANSKLNYNMAICFSNMGKHGECMMVIKEALTLNPNYPKAQMKKARCLVEMEEYEEAVREADQIHKKLKTGESKALLEEAKIALKKSKMKDYYKVLGISKTASEDEIKKAYKKKALLHHPDRHSNASDEEKKVHETRFKEIGEAFTILSDKTKRTRYDNGMDVDGGGAGGFGHNFSDPSDIFNAFFTQSGGGFSFGGPGGHGFQFSN